MTTQFTLSNCIREFFQKEKELKVKQLLKETQVKVQKQKILAEGLTCTRNTPGHQEPGAEKQFSTTDTPGIPHQVPETREKAERNHRESREKL